MLDERSKLLTALESEHRIISAQKAKIFVQKRLGDASGDGDDDENEAHVGHPLSRNQVNLKYVLIIKLNAKDHFLSFYYSLKMLEGTKTRLGMAH